MDGGLFAQQFQPAPTVLVIQKDGLAVVAALNHVVGITRNGEAGLAGQGEAFK